MEAECATVHRDIGRRLDRLTILQPCGPCGARLRAVSSSAACCRGVDWEASRYFPDRLGVQSECRSSMLVSF